MEDQFTFHIVFDEVAGRVYPVGVFIWRFALVCWGDEFMLAVEPIAVAPFVVIGILENDFLFPVVGVEEQVDAAIFVHLHIFDDILIANEDGVGSENFCGDASSH